MGVGRKAAWEQAPGTWDGTVSGSSAGRPGSVNGAGSRAPSHPSHSGIGSHAPSVNHSVPGTPANQQHSQNAGHVEQRPPQQTPTKEDESPERATTPNRSGRSIKQSMQSPGKTLNGVKEEFYDAVSEILDWHQYEKQAAPGPEIIMLRLPMKGQERDLETGNEKIVFQKMTFEIKKGHTKEEVLKTAFNPDTLERVSMKDLADSVPRLARELQSCAVLVPDAKKALDEASTVAVNSHDVSKLLDGSINDKVAVRDLYESFGKDVKSSTKDGGMLGAATHGSTLQDNQHHHWYFIGSVTAIACLLWLIGSIVEAVKNSKAWTPNTRAGLDTIFPGKTDLRVHDGCDDLRWQFWRWSLYALTHNSLRHVLMNALLNISLGKPMEEFNGSTRFACIYITGVVGGALGGMVVDTHSSVVGMSGGCYALIGLQVADVTINWMQRKFRYWKLGIISFLVAYDLFCAFISPDEDNISIAAHAGGFLGGLCMGMMMTRNQYVHDWEKYVQRTAFLVGVVLILVCVGWLIPWAPRSLFESERWCWATLVSNSRIFGDNGWYCVRCDSQECINKWSSQWYTQDVTERWCRNNGGWKVTER